jgi:hypothetical protein
MPYLYNRHNFDTQHVTRKDGNEFKFCDNTVLLDTDVDITINVKEFRGTPELGEPLTCKFEY